MKKIIEIQGKSIWAKISIREWTLYICREENFVFETNQNQSY